MSTVPPDEPTPIPPAEGFAAPSAPAREVPVYDRPEPATMRLGRAIGLAVATLLIGGAGGYLIGHSSSGGGPSSLADAITQTSQGKLARGDLAATLRNGGLRGLFGGGNGGGTGGGTGGGGQANGGGNGGGRLGFRGVVGTVTSVDGNTITVNTQAGDVKVQVSSSTTITKNAPGAVSDLTNGTRIRVQPDSSSSSNGSQVSAQSIQELPAGAGNGPGGFGGPGGPTGGGTATQ